MSVLMIKKQFFLFIFLYLLSYGIYGQSFVKVIPQSPMGVYNSDCTWFDFDNDGDLDFVASGESSTNVLFTRIFENKGNSVFSPAQYPFNTLPNFGELHHTLVNLNDDDRIDMVLIGRIIGAEYLDKRIAMLVNTPNGFQTNNTLTNFSNNGGNALVSWGDVNNDALEDFFISNIAYYNISEPVIKSNTYLNTGSAYTSASGSDFIKVIVGHSEFADIDNDQDLDLVVVGSDNIYPYQNAEAYLNDASGKFVVDARQSFTKLTNSDFSISDYDNDHDLDVLMIGYDSQVKPTTKLYRNSGGIFTEVLNTGLAHFADGSVEWGDYDNDGDSDILLAGFSNNTHPFDFALFKNMGNDKFQEVIDNSFEDIFSGHAAWGDYDNDGDLDINVTGLNTSNVPVMFILRNESLLKNSRPSAPANFSITKNLSRLELKWDASTDNESEQGSLTYNVEIRTDCSTNLFSSFSAPSGWRKVVGQGNVGLNTKWAFNITDDGRYSFRVQAIDGGFLGSEFSKEQIVYLGIPTAPSGLEICIEDNKIKLLWSDNSVNEEYFKIERSINNGNSIFIDSVNYCTTTYYDSPTVNGLYSYRIIASNPNGLSAYSNTASISIPLPLGVHLGDDKLVCNANQFILNATPGFSSYLWNTGATTQSISVSTSGEYWVKASNGCFVFRDTLSLSFETIPEVNLGPDRIICNDQTIELNAGGQTVANFRWQDGSIGSKMNVNSEGLYWVEASNGCGTASDSVHIEKGYLEKEAIKIPNAFTPNGDSYNQFFKIDDGLIGSNLTIYNRWGTPVKILTDYKNNWDGDDLTAGTYYYKLEAKDHCKTLFSLKGWFSILR